MWASNDADDKDTEKMRLTAFFWKALAKASAPLLPIPFEERLSVVSAYVRK
jgi:hypothetical protein